jgi:cytochrome P450
MLTPIVQRKVPVLGRAIDLGRDPDGFLQRCRDELGSVFTVPMLGGPRTFLTNPFDYRAFFQSEGMSFSDVAQQIAGRAFAYDHDRLVRAWGLAELEELYSLLQGPELDALTQRMHAQLARRLSEHTERGTHTGKLYAFISEIVFAAGIEALFGDGAYSPDTFKSYAVVDRYFGLLALGVPARALLGCRKAQRELAAMAGVKRKNGSRFIDARLAHFAAHAIPEEIWGALQSAMVWASQANTVSTAFWTLLFVLHDPRARQAIADEVRAAPDLSHASLKKMVKLESAIAEALRLTSLSLVMRKAQRDLHLDLDDGRRLSVKKGELLTLYPRLTHLDPEIYPSPYAFVFDRFVGDDGAPRQFFKGDRRVSFNLVPFGGGSNMCPGRFFAKNEFKIVVAAVLRDYALDLGSHAVPELQYSRFGLGTPPPTTDVPFRLSRR